MNRRNGGMTIPIMPPFYYGWLYKGKIIVR